MLLNTQSNNNNTTAENRENHQRNQQRNEEIEKESEFNYPKGFKNIIKLSLNSGNGEYIASPYVGGSNKKKAACWSKFQEIYDGKTKEKVPFVVCTTCEDILSYKSANGTSGLTRHIESGCKPIATTTQTKITKHLFNPIAPKKETREKIKKALIKFVALDFRPFFAIEGEG